MLVRDFLFFKYIKKIVTCQTNVVSGDGDSMI